jgi:adenylylsulfate kinase-like enzyme
VPPDHGVTVWFTALPSAGRTTIAGLAARRLAEPGRRPELPVPRPPWAASKE